MPKTILLHDFFEIRGGGERLVLDLAKYFGMDLCYAFWTANSYDPAEIAGLKVWNLQAHTAVPGWRTLKEIQVFEKKTRFLDSYDLALYSGVCAPLAIINRLKGRNIFYCHTPPRFVYDQRQFYLEQIPFWQRPILNWLADYLRPKYENSIAAMSLVIANSENVRRRLLNYLGCESIVVNPPIDCGKFRWLEQGNYYISLARLEPLKRVDKIIKAFQKMPDKKLIIASNGSLIGKLRKLAIDCQNIQFTGWITDAVLSELIGNAIATLYIPIDEDFGMSPVESMAAGKPVIGVAEGGLLETVIDGETGILLPSGPSPEQIVEAVLQMTPERARAMRTACEARAQLFSQEIFLNRMRALIEDRA